MTNTKTIPWNYNKTVMTYKGKEIIEEVEETGGLTRSGKCYSPEELRKAKQIREGQLPIKKPVTEAEAKEFLEKMKVQDYSIIDQLRKTSAQISLLSLLIHSKEYARVLIKVLNKAHISEETTVNQLEKMANRFFEVNRISFIDDELPKEGAGHNKAFHLMVKCERHYVKRVMVNGGSSDFDGSARDTIGEINLTLTIGPVDFEIVLQVVDMVISYNFILGRPWIHTTRAVPSTLHQMLKFEHDMQEIIVHGEDESSIYKDPLIPCIEAKVRCESIFHQAFEVVVMDHVEEGKSILRPRLSATSVMVAAVMLRQGFRPTQADENKAKHRKKHGWVLQQPIPHIFYTFVKPQLQEGQNSLEHTNIDEIFHGLSQMFSEVNMIQDGEGFFVNVGFNNMTCMGNSDPDLKKLFSIEIMHQEVEYDEDKVANDVLVSKKDGKTRVCVDYRDLNKASPKDNFPLPNIHILIDNCAKHEIKSFVDCYAGYHQILMYEDDAEKTTFTTTWGTYYYRVMPFGLKNAGATYMRDMTTIFHDMMHKEIEVYVDDVIIKSKTQADHVIKDYLSKPLVLVPPEPGRPLFLYLSVMDNSFGCVLGKHDATCKKE
ncbi:uncharacterized protein [Nicotiana sylvestris]|uniref:uncharacterized protein n=1 Tax=Nicotiana sylvestris TaxID=4096 RepID=UPI00388C98F3